MAPPPPGRRRGEARLLRLPRQHRLRVRVLDGRSLELSEHLDRLGALLAAEREEERRRFAEARDRLSPLEQEGRGIALVDVSPEEEGVLAGRALVAYGRGGKPLGGGRIGVGSIVRVDQRKERRADAPTGIVARRSRTRVSVAFEEPPPDWATSGRVLLSLEPSPVTWERLDGALRALRTPGAAGKRWLPILTGAPPRFLDRPRPGPPPTGLNPEQEAAFALAERAEDFALVHGPPGTGKTTVLVQVIRAAAARGERVLASAPSNLAVDNLVERLVAEGLDCVRVGHPARVLPAVVAHTLEARAEEREEARIAAGLVAEAFALRRDAAKRKGRRGPGRFSEARGKERDARALLAEARGLEDRAEAAVLDRAQVVLATLTGLDARPLAGRRFPLAVVDEATQATEPALWLALLRADRAILAGDPLQLPPTILSPEAQAGGLGVSLFERLAALHPSARVTLAEQHRMNERIMRFPSDALYGGALRAHPSVAGHALDAEPFLFVDTAGAGFEESTPEGSDSRQNDGEAALAAREVERILATGLPAADVAVISPYDAQVQRLRQLLADPLDAGLEVDTVDGFQGREKEAVVVSLVRSNDAGEVGFLSDVRRMNVAITRARKKLVVVGDSATVACHPFYAAFVRHAEGAGAWRSAFERGAEAGAAAPGTGDAP